MGNKPNFLIILSDEHRKDCIGAYGNKDIKTPHLDSIAADGIVYENCYCTLPVCTPSRYSFLTGLYVHQHMGWSNHSTLPPALSKFPSELKKIGYKTKAVGKMHYTPTYQDVGFDEMELAEQVGPGRLDDDYHRYLRAKGLINATDLIDQVSKYRAKAPESYRENFGTSPTSLDEEDYCTSWIGRKAIESLEKWSDKEPNLLMVGFINPHHPFDVPEPWASMYDPNEIEILSGWTEQVSNLDYESSKGHFPHKDLTEDLMRRITAKYYGSISMLDAQIGKMLKVLKQKDMYDDTIIIYISDHGDYMGYHHMCFKSNFMYDAITNVPLIVKNTNSEDGGKHAKGLVSTIDVNGFILDSADIMIPQTLWKTVRVLDPDNTRDYVFAEEASTIGRNGYMVRSESRKLLYNKGRPSLFFNLDEDPHEKVNLFEVPEYQGEIQEMKEVLFDWLAFKSTPPLYLDEDAPIIDSKNAQKWNDGHREGMEKYLEEKMSDLGLYE